MRGSPERRWPRLSAAPAALAAAAVAVVLLAPRPGSGFTDGPPEGTTGGFGEPTCESCHHGEPPNAPGGALRVVAPETFTPGEEHVVEVRLERGGMGRAGFQLSVRFAGGARGGSQAGELLPVGGDVQVVASHDVAYAGHTATGVDGVAEGVATWRLRWRAPDAAAPVVFHAAANAANDDDSELGDHVYTAEVVAQPAVASQRPPLEP